MQGGLLSYLPLIFEGRSFCGHVKFESTNLASPAFSKTPGHWQG